MSLALNFNSPALESGDAVYLPTSIRALAPLGSFPSAAHPKLQPALAPRMRIGSLVALVTGARGFILGCEFSAGPFTYTNIVRDTRAWVLPTNASQAAPVDSNGWPTTDAFTVVFDDRPAFAWAPPEDDPWGWQPAVNGTYAFNFSGSGSGERVRGRDRDGGADAYASALPSTSVYPGSDPGMKGGMSVTNVTFDPATYTTAGLITIAAGAPALAELIINGTRRTASSPLGSGFTNLRIMRPGHGSWRGGGGPGLRWQRPRPPSPPRSCRPGHAALARAPRGAAALRALPLHGYLGDEHEPGLLWGPRAPLVSVERGWGST